MPGVYRDERVLTYDLILETNFHLHQSIRQVFVDHVHYAKEPTLNQRCRTK